MKENLSFIGQVIACLFFWYFIIVYGYKLIVWLLAFKLGCAILGVVVGIIIFGIIIMSIFGWGP